MKQLKSLNASQNKRMRIIDFPTEGGRSRGKHPHYSPLLKKEYQHESLNHKPVKKEVLRLAVLSLEKDKPQRVIPQCEGRQQLSLLIKSSFNRRSSKESPYLQRKNTRYNSKSFEFESIRSTDRTRNYSKELTSECDPLKSNRNVALRLDRLSALEVPKRDGEVSLQNAKMFLNRGDHRKSILLLKSLLKQQPDHAELVYMLALNWYRLGDYTKVVETLNTAYTSLDKFRSESYKMLAVSYFKLQEQSQCLKLLLECHRCFPEDADSYSIQGKIHFKKENYQLAASCFKQASALRERHEDLLSLAQCYEKLAKMEEASQIYYQLSEESHNFDLLMKYFDLQGKLKHFEVIDQCLRGKWQSLKERSNLQQRSQVYFVLAYTNYKLENYCEARTLAEEGMQTKELPRQFYKLLLAINIIQRDLHEAAHEVDRLRTNNPQAIDGQLNIFMIFVDSVLNLMRRNFKEGVDGLIITQDKLADGQEGEYLQVIRKIFPMFLSYGYYSLGDFYLCRVLIDSQRVIGVDSSFQKGFYYNDHMCNGILENVSHSYEEAVQSFKRAFMTIQEKKLEPILCEGITYVQMALKSVIEPQLAMPKAKQCFVKACTLVGKLSNNSASNVYYHRAILHGHQEEWKDALASIDEAMDRSQDHYWRFYYVRGMLLACVHSFRDAINDLSVAINLSEQNKAECFLLRSKCLQIQGDGNQAFKDLQEYIGLKPNDANIHHYAGQLLFENGAFEDALCAFGDKPIILELHNIDVIMTKAKCKFLLGKFQEAADIMRELFNIPFHSDDVGVDIEVLILLECLANKKQMQQSIKVKLQELGEKGKCGRIFKQIDFVILRAVCQFQLTNYETAISLFQKAIVLKQGDRKKLPMGESPIEIDIGKQIETFDNQMLYNIALSYLMQKNYSSAASVCERITLSKDLPSYEDYMQFLKFAKEQVFELHKQEVFSSRNKLSNFFEKAKLPTRNGLHAIKLCVAFPKVEPPDIFPEFDKSLILRFNVLNVEKKPEAPWVVREHNSIKFTDKIETYSRLELEDSECSSTSSYQLHEIDNSHLGLVPKPTCEQLSATHKSRSRPTNRKRRQ